jgi:diguanylate cyclase (GGDEF)-like protein
MISFLVAIDKVGMITDIKWSNPAYILSSVGQSIYELFFDLDRIFLGEILDSCSARKDSSCDISLRLKNYPNSVKLYAKRQNTYILILGVEEANCEDPVHEIFLKEIVSYFMEAIIEATKENNVLNTETARLQFEKIQYLNNELINTKRMLQKANGTLNTLNSELNNRLVKDALTGLVSRYQYRSEIEHYISMFPDKPSAFVYIDIDDFKSINDNFGHGVGDKYLVEFSERLKRISISNTVKIRIAGDEFGLFAYNLEKADTAELENIWISLRDSILSSPVVIEGIDLPLKISAGIAVYGKDTDDIYELIEFADFAMYGAKKSGKNHYQVFDKIDYTIAKNISIKLKNI